MDKGVGLALTSLGLSRNIRASMRRTLLLLAVLLLPLGVQAQDSLDKLATDFWTWRAQWQPFNADDIPRIERPAGLKPSWSAASIARQRTEFSAVEGVRSFEMACAAAGGLPADGFGTRAGALGA
jgi:hypothetical protein